MKTYLKMYHTISRIFLFTILLIPGIILAEEDLVLQNLKVEYKINPLGIDVMKPRLSWEIRSDKKNTMQTAYELRCSASESQIQKDENLIWKVKESSEQIGVNLKEAAKWMMDKSNVQLIGAWKAQLEEFGGSKMASQS